MRLSPRNDRRRLVVLIAVLVIAGAAAIVVHGPWGGEHTLKGETEQGRSIELQVDGDGRLKGFALGLETKCGGGHRWPTEWAPRGGDAEFRQREGRVVVHELLERRADRRTVDRIGAQMSGHLSEDRAEGEIRLIARFYRDGREYQACDSGPLRWTAGADAARRLASFGPRREPTGAVYPPVPSLAGDVSPARGRFIQETDETCALTHGPARRALQAAAAAEDAAGQLTAYAAYVEAHADQLRALERLGPPSDGVALHTRWIENMRARIGLEGRQLRQVERGELETAVATRDRISRLRLRGNEDGQRFGLSVCTSNGPDRTPVPR